MTEDRIEDWSLLMNKSTSALGGECEYCSSPSNPYDLKKVFIALPWLSPREAKQVLTLLKKSLKPELKVYSLSGVREALRVALSGLSYYPVEHSAGVITLFPYVPLVENQIRAMVLKLEGSSRKLGILYYEDIYPRTVTVEEVFHWGFKAKTAQGFKSFRWDKIQACPENWQPNRGRGKYHFGVHVLVTVARFHDVCEKHGYGLR